MTKEIRVMRNIFPEEWEAQCWDAFMLPLDRLELPEMEEKRYAQAAIRAVDEILWDSYNTTRFTFLACSEALLRDFGRNLSGQEAKQMKKDMYIRFMEGRIQYFRFRERQECCPLPPVPVGEKDFHNTELAAVFAHLPDRPETAAWLKEIGVSWTYEQLHMVTWFSGQLSLGSGKYSRSRPNHSAKTTYERLVNPFSLLWIAAALGEDRDLVAHTRREMDGYVSWRAKCGVVRRAVPWSRIYELALLPAEEEKKHAAADGV